MTRFYIVTPSFNQPIYLRRCMASVRHQVSSGTGFSVCHHIQDGGSSFIEKSLEGAEGAQISQTECSPGYRLSLESEPDSGMYEALNRGIDYVLAAEDSTCSDDVIAWLNCDEQYLPGTLAKVACFFEQHPSVDLLFGGMVMVEPDGGFLACRKALPMRRLFLEASYLYNYSCAMFFRRSLWEKVGPFDIAFKNAGDEDWVHRALVAGARTAVMADYLSTFIYSSDNLSSMDGAVVEHERLKRGYCGISRWFRVPLNGLRLVEKLLRVGWGAVPLRYSVYGDDLKQRVGFEVTKPRGGWPDQKMPYVLSHRNR